MNEVIQELRNKILKGVRKENRNLKRKENIEGVRKKMGG